MDKRLGLALAISIGILFVWWKIFPPQPPQQQHQANPPAETAGAPSAPAAAGSVAAGTAPGTTPAGPEERVTLESADARYVFSSDGGTLREVRLKDPQFLERKGDPESGVQIIHTSTPETAPLRVSFVKADFKLPELPAFSVSRPSADTVVFRSETDAVVLEKRFKLLPNPSRSRWT